MNNQSKFLSVIWFISALMSLYYGLLRSKSAQTFIGEDNSLADTWGMRLVFLLTLSFALGWWIVSVIENLSLSKARKFVILVLLLILPACVFEVVSPLVFSRDTFLWDVIVSNWFILMSGFFFHFSAIYPEVVAKWQTQSG